MTDWDCGDCAYKARIAELEALLDHYRGTCDNCGRVNVLVTLEGSYDDLERLCLLDKEECERLHDVRLEERRQASIKRRAETPDYPMWAMKDYYNREMLKLWRPK